MRCKKARGLYFENRDGLLDESEKMKLQEHLNVCHSCSEYVTEMDQCLGMLGDLPECCPSENFEWNLKRRIVQERARLVRIHERRYFGEWTWGLKFVASAAAVVLIVIGGLMYMDNREGRPGQMAEAPTGDTSVTQPRMPPAPMPDYYDDLRLAGINYSPNLRYPPGLKTVSSRPMQYGGRYEYERQLPFEINTEMLDDSLMQSNALLKQRIMRLERENYFLRQILSKMRVRK